MPRSFPVCTARTACTDRYSPQFKNNHFAEMCSGSEAGSYPRLVDLCIAQGLRVKKKKTRDSLPVRGFTQTRTGSFPTTAALEATQGQMDGFFSQLPYKNYVEEVASVGV